MGSHEPDADPVSNPFHRRPGLRRYAKHEEALAKAPLGARRDGAVDGGVQLVA